MCVVIRQMDRIEQPCNFKTLAHPHLNLHCTLAAGPLIKTFYCTPEPLVISSSSQPHEKKKCTEIDREMHQQMIKAHILVLCFLLSIPLLFFSGFFNNLARYVVTFKFDLKKKHDPVFYFSVIFYFSHIGRLEM